MARRRINGTPKIADGSERIRAARAGPRKGFATRPRALPRAGASPSLSGVPGVANDWQRVILPLARCSYCHSGGAPYLLPTFGRSHLPKPPPVPDVLQGTLDLLILKTLSLAPMHGWGLSHRIQQLSRDALQVGQGSIYPALVRLEQRGWIDTEWRVTENNRRAKYYRLTAAGRRALGEELASWRHFVGAVELVLGTT
jgi:PadR family transcriptional regulator, regulatory protein PadR